jgi:hypothetical protein
MSLMLGLRTENLKQEIKSSESDSLQAVLKLYQTLSDRKMTFVSATRIENFADSPTDNLQAMVVLFRPPEAQ